MLPPRPIADDPLVLRYDPVSRVLTVQDQRCGKTWQQLPFDDSLQVRVASQDARSLRLQISGGWEGEALWELTGRATLSVTLSAASNAPLDKLSFPPAFAMPDREHYLLSTDGEGLLLSPDDSVYPVGEHPFYFCGGGSAMSWMGVTDAQFATGYMAIFVTPFDAAIETKRINCLIHFAPVWLGSMGAFGYQRKLEYVFFEQGGYVAQCKRYREHIWPRNAVKTLRQNEEKFPAIAKMLGAVHIYVWDGARQVDFARKLKEAGIERAMLLWNANHQPYPEKGYDERLKELGYATGGYELFTDIHPDTHPGAKRLATIPLKRNIYPGLYEKLAAVNKDGGHYSNQFGTYVCPQAIRPEIVQRVERELSDYPHETYFLDVYQANGVYECYHPEHRLTRQQYAAAIIENMELLEEKYGTFLGGEWGADYTGSHGVYVHGMMTLQRTWFNTENESKGTIYYMGNWKDNARPSIMLGARTAPPIYGEYSLNEATRIPLYELVYHDAVIISWRWEDCNHHTPELWWKKDLLNILYGTAPLWSIDQDRWEAFEQTFVASY